MVRAMITVIAVAGLCVGCASRATAPPVNDTPAADTALRPVKQTRALCEDPALLVRDLTVGWRQRAYLQGPCPGVESPLGTNVKQ